MSDHLDELASKIEATINEVGESETLAAVLRVVEYVRKDRTENRKLDLIEITRAEWEVLAWLKDDIQKISVIGPASGRDDKLVKIVFKAVLDELKCREEK